MLTLRMLWIGVLALACACAHAQPAPVVALNFAGVISPASAEYIDRGLARAEREKAQLVVIQLDSRGAVGSDRAANILDRMRASRVPIAVWVPPNGCG